MVELVGWGLLLALAADRIIAFVVARFELEGGTAALVEYAGAILVGVAAAALQGELFPITLDTLIVKVALVYGFVRAVYLVITATSNGK